MGLEADSGAVLGVFGDIDGVGDAAASAAAIGVAKAKSRGARSAVCKREKNQDVREADAQHRISGPLLLPTRTKLGF